MKTRVPGKFALLVILLGLFACIPDPLEVRNVPLVKPELVVLTQFVPDETLVVMVTRTFGALEAGNNSDPTALLEQIAVRDAVVRIAGPSGPYELLSLGYGLYGGVEIPFQSGESYTLTVTSASLGEVTATTTAQRRISFNSISARLYGITSTDTLAEVTYSINDPRGRNWYMVNVQHIERSELQEDIINPRTFTRLLDDTNFEGQEYQETFRVFRRNFQPGDTIAVSLSNISDAYYHFMDMRLNNRFSFVEYLSEPVSYPTNIVGGRGFFNLCVPDVRFFVLSEEP